MHRIIENYKYPAVFGITITHDIDEVVDDVELKLLVTVKDLNAAQERAEKIMGIIATDILNMKGDGIKLKETYDDYYYYTDGWKIRLKYVMPEEEK